MKEEEKHKDWLVNCAALEGYIISEIAYIFTTDEELLKLNINFLGHDYYTDILTFDRSENKKLSGDIFISTERVSENAEVNKVNVHEELRRVMIHGVLHMMGYGDTNRIERGRMRGKENIYLKMFHVEQ